MKEDLGKINQTKVYYDAECFICREMLPKLLSALKLENISFLPAQNDETVFFEMKKNNSWVIIDHNKEVFFKFEGFIALCKISPSFNKLVPVFNFPIVSITGKYLYEFIAANRAFSSKVVKKLKCFFIVFLMIFFCFFIK